MARVDLLPPTPPRHEVLEALDRLAAVTDDLLNLWPRDCGTDRARELVIEADAAVRQAWKVVQPA